MGADFVWSYIPYFNITPERIEELKAIVDNSDKPHVKPISVNELSKWREKVKDYLDELQDVSTSREVDICSFKGMSYRILLTGGMSYGEEPTHACRVIECINTCSALYDKIEQYATDDETH